MLDVKQIEKFPTKPGVYLMKSVRGVVLYVGKGKNIRQRVKQYFLPGRDTRAMIPHLVSKVEAIDTIVVSSEKEALLLENTLIKTHKPKYNALLKDDKGYIALKLTHKHCWPKVALVRYHGRPKPDGIYFGPYTSAFAARQTLDLIQRIFPLRQCSDLECARRTRPCILYDMKRCVAPCVDRCTKEEYDSYVKKTIRFLQGKDREVIRDLKRKMDAYSEALEFERAGQILKTIQMVERTVEAQHVDTPLGVSADVWSVYREGSEVILSQMIVRSGKMLGCVPHVFSQIAQDSADLYESYLLQHYGQQEEVVKEILVDEELPHKEILSEVFSTQVGRRVEVVHPKRGARRALLTIARENAESFFRREKDRKESSEQLLLQVQGTLRLTRYPRRIECFDTSHLSGDYPVSALVAFVDGEKARKHYRTYHLRDTKAADDYGALREVLRRRCQKAQKENSLPDLMIIDGGKGHLRVALSVLQELNIISVDMIAVAKEKGRHDKGLTNEQIFLPNAKDPLRMKGQTQLLFFLQRIRDEAHRFVIEFYRKTHKKKLVRSVLEEIPGIGPVKRKALLRHFGSWKKIAGASEKELVALSFLSQANVSAIRKFAARKKCT